MKTMLRNFKITFKGLIVLAFLVVSHQASATFVYSGHDESYEVLGQAITVFITGTSPITLPNQTTTLTWSTSGAPDSCDATPNGLWTGPKSPNGSSEPVSGLSTPGTYTFEIICHKAGYADASSQAQVIVNAANGVTASIIATPNTLPYGGGSTTLDWSSTGATICTGTNFSTGNAVNGSTSASLTTTKTYTVDCNDGAGHSAQAQVTVVVQPQNTGMTVALSANPMSMTLPSNQTTLTWVTTGNPDSCVASNSWSGNKSTGGGSEGMTGLSGGTHRYTITCMKAGYPNDISNVDVVVSAGSKVPTATLYATPSTLPYGGGSSTLTWSSTNATSCTSSDFSTGGATSGTIGVNVSSTTTYSLSCSGFSQTAVASSTIVVLGQTVINGQCSPTHWFCDAGTSINNATGANSWTWNCAGSNGGSTASCSESFITDGKPACSDGSDNDLDGKTDADDPGCHTDGDANNRSSYDPNDKSEKDIPHPKQIEI